MADNHTVQAADGPPPATRSSFGIGGSVGVDVPVGGRRYPDGGNYPGSGYPGGRFPGSSGGEAQVRGSRKRARSP